MMRTIDCLLVFLVWLVSLAIVITGASLEGKNEISKLGEEPMVRRAVDANATPVQGNSKDVTTAKTPAVTPTIVATTSLNINCTERNNQTGECISTYDKGHSGMLPDWVQNNKGILERTLYVLLVITVIVVLYFLVKTIRLRRRKSKTRRYGVLNTNDRDNLEMTPLDQEDEDEDMTVFEVNGHRK